MSNKVKWAIIIGSLLVIAVSIVFVCTTVLIDKEDDPQLDDDSQLIEASPTQSNTVSEHKVLFMADGTVLKTDIVQTGQNAVAPQTVPTKEGYVFNGWDAGYSNISTDMVISAIYTKIDVGKNTIVLTGGKGVSGEILDLYLELCGEVCLCGLDLVMSYDNTALEIVEITDVDGFVIVNFDNSSGEIYLNYVSTNNTDGSVDLCTIRVRVLAQSNEWPIEVKVKQIVSIDENGELVHPEYGVVSTTIEVI